ncbi:MAG: 30S ribosomal protein S12 methylthiotransferase RimO [Clostridiales bacterium]|nr:30S ribosomal protein S12 methylthiotransferase RimO [Clostridiales bacterium]
MNKFYIETLGCLKNEYDSEVLANLFEKEGYVSSSSLGDAEIVIVNTCGFINDAKIESIDKIFDMSRDKNDNSILVVTGCLSQRYYKDLVDDMPEVDLFIGVEEYHKLPELLRNLPEEKYYIEKPKREPLPYAQRKLAENPYTATLKIAEGCNNACAFCIIPRIRGPFRSKSIEDIIKEANVLADAGTKEIVLIAQDVTYYGMDIYGKFMLPKLLTELCKVDKIHWIRLMYCYEERITDELISVMASEDKICNYIDIPIQHISDKVLNLMNRASTSDSIRNTIKRLRDKVVDIHIRTTLLVGFPGETEEDYDELIEFLEEIKFDRLGVFGFSDEENTKAFKMDGHLDDETTEERVNGIMKRQIDISLRHNQSMIGKVYEVIVDERDADGSYLGRTRYDAPEIDNSVIFVSNRELTPGQFVNVEINDAYDYDLVGMEV